ncbi:hypothetical protein AXF42_Ash002207 [Apostasia shenzhenica]|uniref:glycerophosphodiester phosphodiesterase n=1 Tax=Apostasia shenzhenica TaxID=1088818 RepID=A0A2I0AN04_9ASPA|nr:hypothetical protein AXF42_Ash002207 [Apostasia shenzhenica]
MRTEYSPAVTDHPPPLPERSMAIAALCRAIPRWWPRRNIHRHKPAAVSFPFFVRLRPIYINPSPPCSGHPNSPVKKNKKSNKALAMALKAAHVSNVPHLDSVLQAAAVTTLAVSSGGIAKGADAGKFLVVGHRGNGMNLLSSPDPRMKAVKENSIVSFNLAGKFPIDFVEFDVQVTKDGFPIIFHDDFILTEEDGKVIEKRTTDLCLAEFLSYGPQEVPEKVGKPLLRKTKEGRIHNWKVEIEDKLCTFQEALQQVDSHLGFNVELKFDNRIAYTEEELTLVLHNILKVVDDYAGDRPILFSSFQPDAARLMKKLQSSYPVFFLTNGGNEIYNDARRNSLEEAVKHCLAAGLDGIVSEVKGVFRNPSMVHQIKESSLALLTYGQLK